MNRREELRNINWSKIDWKEIEVFVFNLQRKIYDETKYSGSVNVEKYQKLLVKSIEARLLAIRRITQDNQGKATAGVDGIKTLKPEDRMKLISKLVFDGSAQKVRRVYIPKVNRELRPLGIPTILDRCKQMLMKMALEPQWEAKFEDNSYGFRPGYSVRDCRRLIVNQIQGAPKHFLDADIKGCFDNISHNALLNKIDTIPMFEKQIKVWLEAGVMDDQQNDEIDANKRGTPQGRVISPLLTNIALHGMETLLIEKLGKRNIKTIRYADDFVIMSNRLNHVEKAKEIVVEFLATIGLELNSDKTRIGHTMDSIIDSTTGKQSKPGLDFLGFHFRNIRTSIHRGVMTPRGKQRKAFKQISTPSLVSVKKHKMVIRNLLKNLRNQERIVVITQLASVIKGWTEYFSVSQCTKVFSYLDQWTFWKLWRWAVKRYNGAYNARKKCFQVRGWNFGFTIGGKKYILDRHSATKVRNYIKIKPGASIYDGNLMYFAKRLSYHNSRLNRLIKLLKAQDYKCKKCGITFLPNDIIELHHVLNSQNERTDKLQFLHRHCHDEVHRAPNKIN